MTDLGILVGHCQEVKFSHALETAMTAMSWASIAILGVFIFELTLQVSAGGWFTSNGLLWAGEQKWACLRSRCR